MAHVLDLEPVGLKVELLRTGEETGGELLEFEVSGRSRGFLAQGHVHPDQEEHLEMVEGAMRVVIDGREHIIGPGESVTVPVGSPHSQIPHGEGDGRVRITVRPAGNTQAFLERLAEMSAKGEMTRSGFPKPLAGARLISDFWQAGYAAKPPLRVQLGLARALLAPSHLMRPYEFVDEWDVAAPPEAVFDAIADARSYPDWWSPVYIDVESDGPPEIGKESRQHFKGRLPYHVRTRSVISELDPPHTIAADVDGDLRGRGVWTLTPTARGTHVRFDWRVHADRRLLRALTPVLRPLLRWNHAWAIARAMEGLEPYAQRRAAADQAMRTAIPG
jgi:mannose-6-phosphate isomerase-like protein (cupin superfamily)/uncharacterized protein YndB with AHSA1/START domain